MPVRVSLVAVLAILWCSTAVAQQPYMPVRLDRPPEFDGRVDDPVWSRVEPLPMTMNFPVFRGQMTLRTEIRIAYDDDYLYAAGRFESPAASARSLTRDRASESDELFTLVLDSFDDNENALIFSTTPAGIRVDQSVFGDAQILNGQMPVNESWNTHWDVLTSRTGTGWEAEIRIPWSSLRFQDIGGQVDMGLLAWWWSPSETEGHTFPEIDPKWGFLGSMKPSIAHPVRFEGVYARRPVYVTPYVLGGFTRESEQASDGAPWATDTDPVRDLGLDVKYSLTSNMTLDVTLNTDFAQVEADDRQVNLTRFSLFFPEKRQFFQERSSIFEFNTGGQTRLFYSRTIGLSDEGPVRLIGGVRAVGRVGGWDVGIMDLQTGRAEFETDDGPLQVPSENFGVVRVRRRVFNTYSNVGGILTSRLGEDGTYNMAYGVDGTIRLNEKDYVLAGWAQTFDDTVSTQLASPASSLARLLIERRTNTGLAWQIGVTRAGADYVPGMGFIFRTDFIRFGDQVFYTWQPSESSPFYSVRVGMIGETYLRNDDGSLESAQLGPSLLFVRRSGSMAMLQPTIYLEDLRESFELDDDIEIPEGRYRFAGVTGMMVSAPTLFRVQFQADLGSFYDGWRWSIGVTPTWNVSPHLELGGEIQVNRLRFPDRDEHLDADIVRLRMRAALDTRLSFLAFIQFDRAADEIGANVRLRYNFGEGNDLYVVYNEGLNTRRDRERPRLPASESRAVLVKYTYTFGK